MKRRLARRIERVVCRTVGCSSWFARHWEWPHRVVCTRLVDYAWPEYG